MVSSSLQRRWAMPVMTLLAALAVAPAARAFDDLSGNPCRRIEVSGEAWSYWEQPQYMARKEFESESTERQDELKHHAWIINDNFENHLQPAQIAMRSETGTGVGGSVSANLDWTLVRIPNHPLALKLLSDYAFIIKEKPRHQPLKSAPECYFQSAMNFAPKDANVRALYGVYLFRLERYELALKYFDEAVALNPRAGEAQYNRGLTLAKLGRYEEAAEAAREAYRRGYTLPGLRRILERKGIKVAEAPATKPTAASSDAASADAKDTPAAGK